MLCKCAFMCTCVTLFRTLQVSKASKGKQFLTPTIKPNSAKLALFCYKCIDYYKILIPFVYVKFSHLHRINHGSLTRWRKMWFLKILSKIERVNMKRSPEFYLKVLPTGFLNLRKLHILLKNQLKHVSTLKACKV